MISPGIFCNDVRHRTSKIAIKGSGPGYPPIGACAVADVRRAGVCPVGQAALSVLRPIGDADTSYTFKVVSITDGDILRVLDQNGQLKISLVEIDSSQRK